MAASFTMRKRQDQPPIVRDERLRKFGLLAALSAPWLALLGYLAYVSRLLTDDAFISFRYVRNLLEGNGLVWNPGERVEGYSNFLWVLELAAIWAVTGVPPEDAVWWLSAAYTVATLGVVAWWTWRLPGLRERGLVWWMALGLLCSSATFATWTSGGGLETRQFTFFVVLAVVALTAHRGSRRALLIASLSLALASLTRPEGPLIAACCFAWWAAQEVASGDGERHGGGVRGWVMGLIRRVDWRGALWLALPFALIVGAHFLWRYSYYGEWLPNTYYAKYVRPWWDVGLRYLAAAGLETGLYLLLPLAGLGAWARWREGRSLAYALPLLIIAAHMAYIARIGGDNFQWRPLDFYWPLLALPAADVLSWAGAGIANIAGGMNAVKRFAHGRLCAVALFLPTLFYAGAMQGALLQESLAPPPGRFIPLDARNAGWVLAAPGMPALVAASNELREALAPYASGLPVYIGRVSADYFIRIWGPYADMARGLIPDDAVDWVKGAGVKPYYLPDLTFVDNCGLNDYVIARNPVTRLNNERIFAHDRQPPPGYLDERGVNFSVFPAAPGAGAALGAAPYALEVRSDVWMPFDAPSLEWAAERFDSFVVAEDLFALVEDSERRLASSRFDVYDVPASDSPLSGGRRLLAYAREPCAEEDVRAQFFLHLSPVDASDLPEERKQHGFDNLNFAFADWGARQGERCVAFRYLPDYPIASVSTGQFTPEEVVWESVARFAATYDVAALLDEDARLLVSSRFDVYDAASDSPVSGGRRTLIYVKEPCAEEDVRAKFFLHLSPVDASDLSEEREQHGFDNLDFEFADWGDRRGERCIAFRYLPDYPIASVRTGQFTSAGRVWDAEFPLPDDGRE